MYSIREFCLGETEGDYWTESKSFFQIFNRIFGSVTVRFFCENVRQYIEREKKGIPTQYALQIANVLRLSGMVVGIRMYRLWEKDCNFVVEIFVNVISWIKHCPALNRPLWIFFFLSFTFRRFGKYPARIYMLLRLYFVPCRNNSFVRMSYRDSFVQMLWNICPEMAAVAGVYGPAYYTTRSCSVQLCTRRNLKRTRFRAVGSG